METKASEKTRRPIRNRRHNRRAFGEEKRPPKRLFTPEIKKYLKDWLVRRRDNPYPNRDEKKTLAVQTGLTYIQVCNWFANWRRKLKNAGREPQRQTWGHLIKTYNSQVRGNVEHFSICSEDSIWYEMESESNKECPVSEGEDTNLEDPKNPRILGEDQCFYVSSTTELELENPFSQQQANKYKNHIIEKYLRDCQKPENKEGDEGPSMISRWLESAVNFKPNENNYLSWTLAKSERKRSRKEWSQHGKEELDAAEALTALAYAAAAARR